MTIESEALRPFADFWTALCAEEPDAPQSGHVVLDDVRGETFIHYSDLRRAADALAKSASPRPIERVSIEAG